MGINLGKRIEYTGILMFSDFFVMIHFLSVQSFNLSFMDIFLLLQFRNKLAFPLVCCFVHLIKFILYFLFLLLQLNQYLFYTLIFNPQFIILHHFLITIFIESIIFGLEFLNFILFLWKHELTLPDLHP